MDRLVAEQADILRRWFDLGCSMTPTDLRVRVEQEEALAQQSGAAAHPDGQVIYLPGCEPQGGEHDGAVGQASGFLGFDKPIDDG